MLVYCCLHSSAPGYLASDLQRVSHLNAHSHVASVYHQMKMHDFFTVSNHQLFEPFHVCK